MNNEEQMKVLQMVADGIITVEEGEKLLVVLENAAQSEATISDDHANRKNNSKESEKQSKLEKKYQKEYKKHLKRTQKLAEKYNHLDLDDIRTGEDRLTKAADELAQKAVDKAMESIGKKVEDISNSIFN